MNTNKMNTLEKIERDRALLTEWRRDFHAHPEIGLQEKRTSQLVAERLASFGCEVETKIGITGVVGTLRVGGGNRSIGLRADMDALPILEANTFDHKSSVPGMMHACGHDGHTTMLLGAAKYLAETKNFNGTVHFIFQPAEEGLGGATAMLKDGLLQKFPCESLFALHNYPGLEVGAISLRDGPMMASGAFFDITVQGKGCHGAFPERGIDPIVISSNIVGALQTVVSRNMRPIDAGVVSVTQFHGGTAYNVIPERVLLSGTARAFSRKNMEVIENRIRSIVSGVATGHGASAEVDFRLIFAPTINDKDEAEFFSDVASALVGPDNISRQDLLMGSEDFSFMLEQCPGVFAFLGNGMSGGELHSDTYEFNDEILPIGASLFARIVEQKLQRAGAQ